MKNSFCSNAKTGFDRCRPGLSRAATPKPLRGGDFPSLSSRRRGKIKCFDIRIFVDAASGHGKVIEKLSVSHPHRNARLFGARLEAAGATRWRGVHQTVRGARRHECGVFLSLNDSARALGMARHRCSRALRHLLTGRYRGAAYVAGVGSQLRAVGHDRTRVCHLPACGGALPMSNVMLLFACSDVAVWLYNWTYWLLARPAHMAELQR